MVSGNVRYLPDIYFHSTCHSISRNLRLTRCSNMSSSFSHYPVPWILTGILVALIVGAIGVFVWMRAGSRSCFGMVWRQGLDKGSGDDLQQSLNLPIQDPPPTPPPHSRTPPPRPPPPPIRIPPVNSPCVQPFDTFPDYRVVTFADMERLCRMALPKP